MKSFRYTLFHNRALFSGSAGPTSFTPVFQGEAQGENLAHAAEDVFKIHNVDSRPRGREIRSTCAGDVVLLEDAEHPDEEAAAMVFLAIGSRVIPDEVTQEFTRAAGGERETRAIGPQELDITDSTDLMMMGWADR